MHQRDAARTAGLGLFSPADTLDHSSSQRGDVTVRGEVGKVQVGHPVLKMRGQIFSLVIVVAAANEQAGVRKDTDPVDQPFDLPGDGGSGSRIDDVAGDGDCIKILRHPLGPGKPLLVEMKVTDVKQTHNEEFGGVAARSTHAQGNLLFGQGRS